MHKSVITFGWVPPLHLETALTPLKLHAVPVGCAPTIDLRGDVEFVMYAAIYFTL